MSKNLQQHREVWRTAGQHAPVIDTGGIGRATASLLKTAGMNPSPSRAGEPCGMKTPDFNKVHESADLHTYVACADHLVLIAQLTKATRGILSKDVLSAMMPPAHMVNVGRGALVDEEVLVHAPPHRADRRRLNWTISS